MINRIKNAFLYYSGNHIYTDYSILKTLIWKFGVVRRLFGDMKSGRRHLLKNLEAINQNHKIKSQKPALICATGPSLNEIDIDFLNDFQLFGDIFSVNYFPLTEIGSKCKIDYQIVLDVNLVKKEPSNLWMDKFYQWLTNDFDGKVIAQIGSNVNFSGETIYLKGLTATSFSKSINPMRGVVGFPPYTTLFAISTAIWLGYKPIYVCGLDASQHSYIKITENGAVLKSHHADTSYPYPVLGKWDGRPDATSVLSSNALVIEKMKLFKKYSVQILGSESHIDTLPRILPHEILSTFKNK